MQKNTIGGGGESTFKTLSETSEKIVECTINPFISFIEKQGLKGEGGILSPEREQQKIPKYEQLSDQSKSNLAGRQQTKSVRLPVCIFIVT